MTNILYGVHGIGHDHAIRALTIARSFPQHNFFGGKQDKRKILQSIESFQPDLAITDYESHLPWICKITGLSCLSIDHQHIARFSYPKLPFSKRFDLALLRTAIWIQFRDVKNQLIGFLLKDIMFLPIMVIQPHRNSMNFFYHYHILSVAME